MKNIKQKLWLLLSLYLSCISLCFADSNAFTATYVSNVLDSSSQPILFNMVPGSKQQLKFLVTPVYNKNVIIQCGLSSTTKDTFSNLGGCLTGAGATQAQPLPIVFTITAGSTPGLVTHVFTLKDKSGRNILNYTLAYTILPNAYRTITFQNYCNFPVYFGIGSGTMPPISGSSCATSANCPTGTQCTGGKCFWIPPTPNTAAASPEDTYLLAPYTSGAPATNSITIPDYSASNGSSKQWSGGFAARTGCSFSGGVITCTTGDCGNDGTGKGGCALGQSFGAPSTQAEVTFLAKEPDSYDVTVINGFNVPVTMTPNFGVGKNNPYDCGVPGATTATTYVDALYSTSVPTPYGQLSACSWTFSPPSLYYQWVDSSTATPCSSNTTCAPLSCGLTKTNVQGNVAALTCGKLLGYWTQDEICATNSSFSQSAVVNCTSKTMIANCTANGTTCPVTVNNQYSFFNLLACTSSPPDAQDNTVTFPSCFSAGNYSSINCCGCNNWQNTPGVTSIVPNDPAIVSQCGTGANTVANQNWVTNVLENLKWLKNSCPSVYTYPYDDKSASFTCPYRYEQGQSAMNYTITFCPNQINGGVTPLT